MSGDLEEAKSHLQEHGWVKISSILTSGEASEALSRLWKAKDASEASGIPSFQPILDPNAANIRVPHLPELDQTFRDMLLNPTGIELVKSLLGERFLVSNFSANIARPGSQSMALHSDQSVIIPEPWLDILAVNVVWCLTKTTKENGATLYIPGSHKWTHRKDIPSNAPELLVPFKAEAGDIIVLDGRLWHTSGSNITKDEDRALLFAYYSAPYMRPIINWSAKLSKELQESFSPELKELLGLSPIAYVVNGDLRYMADQFPTEKVTE